MKRLLPFPYLSLLLLIVWLLMNNSASPGHILLGLIFALLIPLGTSSMRKNQPTLKKPLSAAKYLLMLMGDIIVSNVEVAIQVLGPVRKISPGLGIGLLLNLWRLLKGPSVLDRVLALDTMYINSIALIVLLGLYFGSPLYFEGALLIAMLGFVSTAALCKYLVRGDLIE